MLVASAYDSQFSQSLNGALKQIPDTSIPFLHNLFIDYAASSARAREQSSDAGSPTGQQTAQERSTSSVGFPATIKRDRSNERNTEVKGNTQDARTETHTAVDRDGTSYTYTVDRDLQGRPIRITGPALNDGKNEGVVLTTRIEYEVSEKLAPNKIELEYAHPGGKIATNTLCKRPDGNWEENSKSIGVPEPIALSSPPWNANPKVALDGTVTLCSADGRILTCRPNGVHEWHKATVDGG